MLCRMIPKVELENLIFLNSHPFINPLMRIRQSLAGNFVDTYVEKITL